MVDRLLASPRYGERWGRYWLDVARYSDDQLNSTQEEPHPNAFRYRDWVIQAFNNDMPYDMFVKAQIAGDLMPPRIRCNIVPGLGFYALSPEMQDDRVDATTRGFLGLTVACAQCHDHKFDPDSAPRTSIRCRASSPARKLNEVPLAPKDVVEKWDAQKKALDKQETRLKEFIGAADRSVGRDPGSADCALSCWRRANWRRPTDLDAETLERWNEISGQSEARSIRILKPLVRTGGAQGGTREEFGSRGARVSGAGGAVNEEKNQVDEQNQIRLGLESRRAMR